MASVGKGDEAARLRPTSDRVRESLFNVLMSRFGDPVEGAGVLDLFAGTGALGLEALSRGASKATFVENGRVSQKILRQNVDICDVADVTQVITRDAVKLSSNHDDPFDLIFLDPPYGKMLGEAALRNAMDHGWIAKNSVVVWEEGYAIEVLDRFTLLDERRYGDTVVHFLEAE
ncbi:MAG: 16S rRNA (guanine(966)-N(2))-methyltransferase RsmD [Pseudomonadota bacterium]